MSGASDEAGRVNKESDLLLTKISIAKSELEKSREYANATALERASLESELERLESEASKLSEGIQGARRTLSHELSASMDEARALEREIAEKERELATRRAEINARLQETQAASAAATELANQLRAQLAQRGELREEAARIRARLQEKRALHLHTEMVALEKATKNGNTALHTKLEEIRNMRIEYQAELKTLGRELEALRVQVTSGLEAKAQAEGVLLTLGTELISAQAQLERTKAIEARSPVS